MADRNVAGVAYVGARVIVIARGLTPEEEDSTIAHEALHALISGQELLTDEQEERLCRGIDAELVGVFRQLVATETE